MRLTELPDQKIGSLDFLSGGGEMGDRIRNHDWSKTPIGPPQNWEQSLKTCLRIMLTSPQPMFVWWGKELINIYNDAYRFVLGEKHPVALGARGDRIWKEIWDQVGARARIVFNKNEGTYDEGLLLIMNRHGYEEETYFNFSYNPVPGDRSVTAGLFCACTEETSRIINERSLNTLRELDVITQKQSEQEIYELAARALAYNNKDFPFGIIYKVSENGKTAVPASFFGIQEGNSVFPEFIDLTKSTSGTSNFFKAYKSGDIVVSENGGRRKKIPTGFWKKEATHFVHIPIIIPGSERPIAVISAALNPYRKFDNHYRQFAQMIADRTGIAISNVLSFEQEKKKVVELAELDRAKTVFFSNISHEFRTPLTLMLGTIEESLNDPLTIDKNVERLNVTHRNAMRLLKLVNTLLDFSRIESGRQKAVYALTDISSLTKNLASNFRSIIEKAGLEFRVDADRIIQPVYIDHQMWEKIVFNLISNAFKYTLSGTITLKLNADDKNVILEVSDTGVGIPENDLEHMFERFHRVQNVVGRTYEGTGIGLSLTKELVAMHGGTIAVKSKVDKGSTFTVTIPIGKDHLPAEQTTVLPDSSDHLFSDVYLHEASSFLANADKTVEAGVKDDDTPRVLIVDDNADMRVYLQSILEHKYHVITAGNGMEALHKIGEQKPAIVISDIMMPVMDGVRLLKEIKDNNGTSHIPVILLTARAGEESKIKGYETGADDYLVKPFSAKELMARIEAQVKIGEKRTQAFQSVYKLFNDVSFAVAVLKGKDLVVEYVNKYNLDLWQMKWEEVQGRPLFSVRPDIRESVESIHREVYETGKRIRYSEIPVEIVVDGKTETKYFDATIDPMFDEEGMIIGQIAASIDVTDKVIARKKVVENNQRLQLVTDAIPSLISYIDKDLCYQFNNKSYEEWFGTPAGELKGRSLKEVLGEGAFEALEPYFKKALSGEEVSFESSIPYASGGKRYIMANYIPHIADNNEVLGFYALVNDITERKNAEEIIKASEEKNRIFIEYAPAAMAMFDKEMRYVSVSKQWMEDYDLKGDIIGKKHYDLFPNILERWKEVHSRCMQGIQERSDEDFYIKDDGTPVWLQWEVMPWYTSGGEVGGIVIFTENITERKKAQQALKESEQRFRNMADTVPATIWITEKDGSCSYLSPLWCEITGQAPEEAFGFGWLNAVHPDDIDKTSILFSEANKSKKAFSLLFRLRTRRGEYRWAIDSGRPRFDESGKFIGFIGSVVDVHEQKVAEHAIRESEERFRTMANEAPLFVWMTDEYLQTTYLNKVGLEYFNLEPSVEMAELSWKKYIHPDDLERVLAIMNESSKIRESYTLEMRLKNGITGEYRWFLDKGAPRYSGNKFAGFIGTTLDIHNRKETEKELESKVKERTRELAKQNTLLQKQNELVRKIFDASADPIAVYDTEMRLITLNQASLDLLGLPSSKVIGKKLLEVAPQMEGTKGHSDLQRAIAGETIHNKIYHSEVSRRYFENFLMPLKDEHDQVYAVLVMAHDNTDLIVSAEKLKEAQQIAQIGHWDWDVVTNKLTWSDNMYNIYGLNMNEGVDYERFISLVHPDDRKKMQAGIDYALQTHEFADFFHRIITPGGEEKIMHARGEVITGKNGKVIRMVGTGQDVTRQKKTEQELIATNKKIEERNHFIEQLINSSLDLITVIDKEFRVITLNRKAQVIYNEYYKEELIGKKITEIDPPLKGTESIEDIKKAFNGMVVIKDKVKSTISERYFEHNYIPLVSPHGEIYAVMIISHEITESIRQMETLRKLYESDEQKNNFIAMASHELKTPITSIKGYVQLLLSAMEKEKDREQPLPPLLIRSSLLSVDKQIKRLTRLISELLDISKIETGTLELKKEKFSLNELAIETVEDILYTNTKHAINLYHDHHSYVFGDKDRIGQVMINFLTNAIKYSPGSEKIDVNIRKKAGDLICFSVTDYGIGIDKKDQEKIFDKFYRARGKAEQTYPGFGIGLFIANEFIQKHGGQVWVESEKGRGSTFTFTLPILKEQ